MYKNIKTIYKKTQIITSIIFIIFTLQIKFLFAESNNDNINAKKLNEIIKLIENNNLNKAFQIAKSENSDDLILLPLNFKNCSLVSCKVISFVNLIIL